MTPCRLTASESTGRGACPFSFPAHRPRVGLRSGHPEQERPGPETLCRLRSTRCRSRPSSTSRLRTSIHPFQQRHPRLLNRLRHLVPLPPRRVHRPLDTARWTPPRLTATPNRHLSRVHSTVSAVPLPPSAIPHQPLLVLCNRRATEPADCKACTTATTSD